MAYYEGSSSNPRDTWPYAGAWTPGTAEKNCKGRRTCQRCFRKPGYRRMCKVCLYLVGPCCEAARYNDAEILCSVCADGSYARADQAVEQEAARTEPADGARPEESDAHRGDDGGWQVLPRHDIGDRGVTAQEHSEDVRCPLCAITLDGSAAYLDHLNSKKHRKNAQSAELDLLRRDWCQTRVLAHGGEEFEGPDGMMVRCRVCDALFNGRAAYIFHLGQRKHKKVLEARGNIGRGEEDGSPVPPDPPPVPAAPSSAMRGSRWYILSDEIPYEIFP